MTTRNDYQKSYPFYKLSLTPNFFYNNVLKYIMEYMINTKYHINVKSMKGVREKMDLVNENRREVNERDVGFEIKYSYSFTLLGCVFLLTMKNIV